MQRSKSLALAIVGLGLLAGCGTHAAPPISDSDLQLASQFHLFTFYWVGRSFHSLQLTAADSTRDYDATVGMRVYYGNCVKPSSILSTKGCQLPLEIATVLYRPHSLAGFGARRQTTIRGVPAVAYNGGSSIELYTGHLAIDIYAGNPQIAQAAAQALVPLNRQRTAIMDLVPPRYVPGVGPHESPAGSPPLAPLARPPKHG